MLDMEKFMVNNPTTLEIHIINKLIEAGVTGANIAAAKDAISIEGIADICYRAVKSYKKTDNDRT
jgi:hypothetical protein